MPMFRWLPQDMHSCCWCITDLKAAVAVIIIFGIVTSPAISWALIRHSYVIRVSCHVTTSSGRTDIVDVNLNNVLSFGFGANAGLGPSCMHPKSKENNADNTDKLPSNTIINIVKYFGWILLFVDIIFLIFSIALLFKLYRGVFVKILRMYMYSVAFSVGLSFIYGLLYVTLCCVVGGSFPLFEFFFTVFDLLLIFLWVYLMLVMRGFLYNLEHGDPRGYLNIRPKSVFDIFYESYSYYKNAFLSRISWLTSLFRLPSRKIAYPRDRQTPAANPDPEASGGNSLHRII